MLKRIFCVCCLFLLLLGSLSVSAQSGNDRNDNRTDSVFPHHGPIIEGEVAPDNPDNNAVEPPSVTEAPAAPTEQSTNPFEEPVADNSAEAVQPIASEAQPVQAPEPPRQTNILLFGMPLHYNDPLLSYHLDVSAMREIRLENGVSLFDDNLRAFNFFHDRINSSRYAEYEHLDSILRRATSLALPPEQRRLTVIQNLVSICDYRRCAELREGTLLWPMIANADAHAREVVHQSRPSMRYLNMVAPLPQDIYTEMRFPETWPTYGADWQKHLKARMESVDEIIKARDIKVMVFTMELPSKESWLNAYRRVIYFNPTAAALGDRGRVELAIEGAVMAYREHLRQLVAANPNVAFIIPAGNDSMEITGSTISMANLKMPNLFIIGGADDIGMSPTSNYSSHFVALHAPEMMDRKGGSNLGGTAHAAARFAQRVMIKLDSPESGTPVEIARHVVESESVERYGARYLSTHVEVCENIWRRPGAFASRPPDRPIPGNYSDALFRYSEYAFKPFTAAFAGIANAIRRRR